jgi:hypothetical protein
VGKWDIPHLPVNQGGKSMKNAIVDEYDVSLDAKKRCVIRGVPKISKYHVQVYKTGRIVMDPMLLVPLKNLSAETRSMLISSIKNLKEGRAGGKFDPKEFPELIQEAEKSVSR